MAAVKSRLSLPVNAVPARVMICEQQNPSWTHPIPALSRSPIVSHQL
ncbi:MAG: hypothetical protein GX108_03435 [Thermovirga sp.]|nr:hypothetical protein [Thermovirga sp.]